MRKPPIVSICVKITTRPFKAVTSKSDLKESICVNIFNLIQYFSAQFSNALHSLRVWMQLKYLYTSIKLDYHLYHRKIELI